MEHIRPAADLRLNSILLATDFSQASEKALRHALAIARHYGAKFSLAYVVSSLGFRLVGPNWWTAIRPGGILASFSDHRLGWLYFIYGVIGGTGVGLSYIVPVAVLLKWFPDRRRLITGIAVGGFGAGALVTCQSRRGSFKRSAYLNRKL